MALTALAAPIVLSIVVSVMGQGARAHGFEERYDLPLPLPYVVLAACAVVALSFAVLVAFMRDAPAHRLGRCGREIVVPRWLLFVTRGVGWLLFWLGVAAALWGSRDPQMNLAPTLVWIVWWLGMGLLSCCVGNVWALFDPWRTTFELLDTLARRCGRSAGAALGWRWSAALGLWPAAALLLLWCWLEVVSPLASMPQRLGLAALAWTLISLLGMLAFGRVQWQARGDVFAIVFATFSRMAPLHLRVRGESTEEPQPPSGLPLRGHAAFVIAMLASVIFDGWHGGAVWLRFELAWRALMPAGFDVNGHVVGGVGLLAAWLILLGVYEIAMRTSLAALSLNATDASLAVALVPIAAAYNLAHNFSSAVTQGLSAVQLLSDPFGWQWDVLGTARWAGASVLVDARLTWWVAVSAIVLGHVASLWWSHSLVMSRGVDARRAALAMLPLTLAMLAFTAISLTLIAEPMGQSPR